MIWVTRECTSVGRRTDSRNSLPMPRYDWTPRNTSIRHHLCCRLACRARRTEHRYPVDQVKRKTVCGVLIRSKSDFFFPPFQMRMSRLWVLRSVRQSKRSGTAWTGESVCTLAVYGNSLVGKSTFLLGHFRSTRPRIIRLDDELLLCYVSSHPRRVSIVGIRLSSRTILDKKNTFPTTRNTFHNERPPVFPINMSLWRISRLSPWLVIDRCHWDENDDTDHNINWE